MRRTLKYPFPLGELAALLTPGQDAFVVGGTVRDMALGRATLDVDLAVTGSVSGLARRAADRLGGTAFVMDAGRDVHRVVVRGVTEVQVDLAPLKGDINTDLAQRDFTINAMALKVGGQGSGVSENLKDVIDPFGGMDDIKGRVIRAIGREALEADPLRMLRAFRLSQHLGFDIDARTLSFVKELAVKIAGISAERVRDEIYLMLSVSGAAQTFRRMAEAGLLKEALPETKDMAGLEQEEPHVYDLLNHSLKAMEYSEKVMHDTGRYFGPRGEDLWRYLCTEADGGLEMYGLVKLAALLHDAGKPTAIKYGDGRIRFIGHDEEGARINEEMALRMRLSVRAARALAAITRWHMRPLHMSKQGMTRHALYRYCRDMGEDLPGSLVVALADAFATRDKPDAMWTDVEGVALAAAEYYYGEYTREKEEPLIRGRDLIELFALTPGPLFSELLDEVAEKRAEGEIKDRQGAIKYIEQKLKSLPFL